MGLPGNADFFQTKLLVFPKVSPEDAKARGQVVIGITPLFQPGHEKTANPQACCNVASWWLKAAQWLPKSWQSESDNVVSYLKALVDEHKSKQADAPPAPVA